MNTRTKFLLAIVFVLGAIYFWPQGDMAPPEEQAAPPAETVPEPDAQALPSGNPLALLPAVAGAADARLYALCRHSQQDCLPQVWRRS